MNCHVCGRTGGVRQPRNAVPPTCSRNTCLLVAAGMITLAEGRERIRKALLKGAAK